MALCIQQFAMDSLTKKLPPPVYQAVDRPRTQLSSSSLIPVVEVGVCPPYGQRKGWIPRKQEDFGEGGAFPEIHVPQFPLGMGTNKKSSNSSALAKQLDAEGKIKYDVLARQGQRPDKIVYSKFSDLRPKAMEINGKTLLRPQEEEMKESTEKTKNELQKIVSQRLAAAMPVKAAEPQGGAVFMRYTPAQQGPAFNSGAKQSIIRVLDVQVDPMEPPKFRTNKKIPRAEPSPPAPVLHSPNKKISVKEQQEWKIPPCVSNWKNSKGYTIPLDKRLAADGRGLQAVHANERFANLAEALFLAERKAREAIEVRALMQQKVVQKEKEQKEEKLKALAKAAREQRSGITKTQNNEEVQSREELRRDLAKERQRDRNIARAAPDKRNRLQKERERDISEKIALGMPNPGNRGETMYDQRLFNQTKGMDSGFAGGEDENYDVYDQPWRADRDIAAAIYKPSKNTDGFGGTRDGPIQFEKEDEDDPFGLNKFLDEAKQGGQKRRADDDKAHRHHHEHSSSKKAKKN